MPELEKMIKLTTTIRLDINNKLKILKKECKKECKKLQQENEVQRERIKSLENINIQNELIIQELRTQFTEEVKKKSGEYKILK